MSILYKVKPPTGEPDAGEPPVRFGGRGGQASVLPTPIIYYPGYGHTTLSEEKLDKLVSFLEACLSRKIDGHIIECGVFRGGSLVRMAERAKELAPDKTVFGVDTFEGHPYDSREDQLEGGKIVHRKGLFSGSRQECVQAALNEKGLDRVRLCKGTVEQVLPQFAPERFCFAHLDMDLYQSTKAALLFLKTRMVTGGTVVFDDYGSPDAPGVKKAVDEILGVEAVTVTIEGGRAHQACWIRSTENRS